MPPNATDVGVALEEEVIVDVNDRPEIKFSAFDASNQLIPLRGKEERHGKRIRPSGSDVLVSQDIPFHRSYAFSTIFSGDSGTNSMLHVVQMARVFSDSKTFVDMKVRTSPNVARTAFNCLMAETANEPSRDDVVRFVDDHFTLDNQMEDYMPDDWQEAPPKLVARISDPIYRRFALELNDRWKILSRKISDEVARNPDLYSLIYLPHPVIVPGGRFREIYYWDSFWIIRGLLLCDMIDTARGMLLNFVHLIDLYGLIPNGGRKYYINRSQPPLFIQMVEEYFKATGDVNFIKNNLQYMVKEFKYWMDNHMVTVTRNGKSYRLARYNCEDNGPRPESYFEDYTLADAYCSSNEEERKELYWEMKTGAETGWDYSSRWMIKDGTNRGSLGDTKARYILPVDLNAYLERNARILARYSSELANPDPIAAEHFTRIANGIAEGIDELLWSEADGVWYDYDILNKRQRDYFTPSNLTPLWTESFMPCTRYNRCARAVWYLQRQGLSRFPGGVPTTYLKSEQQWDSPNCWPPLEHMLVVGLEKTGMSQARDLAFQIAEKRVRGSLANFTEKKHMFEKYHCDSASAIGGGGEYEIQIGFGWSNGVVLDFLDMFGARLAIRADDLRLLNLNAEDLFTVRYEDSSKNKRTNLSALNQANVSKDINRSASEISAAEPVVGSVGLPHNDSVLHLTEGNLKDGKLIVNEVLVRREP